MYSSPSYSAKTRAPPSQSFALDKKFKGKLPITELTEDEAITHALNRLAYGPRPGDVERIEQIGLEKWIDQQLHPDSIDDSALDAATEEISDAHDVVEAIARRVPATESSRQARGHHKGRSYKISMQR